MDPVTDPFPAAMNIFRHFRKVFSFQDVVLVKQNL